jgi:hypothetical protein
MKKVSLFLSMAIFVILTSFSCKKDDSIDPADQLVGSYQGTFGSVGYPSTSESCKVVITKPKNGFIDIGLNYNINSGGKRIEKIFTLQGIEVTSSTAFDGKSSNYLFYDMDYYSSSGDYVYAKGSVGGGNISFTLSGSKTFNGKKV